MSIDYLTVRRARRCNTTFYGIRNTLFNIAWFDFSPYHAIIANDRRRIASENPVFTAKLFDPE